MKRLGKRQRIVLLALALVALGTMSWKVGFARGRAEPELAASGTVEATEAQLGFQAPGRIDALAVREGQAVHEGMELAWLDRSEVAARRQQSIAQAAVARAQLLELERGPRSEELAQATAARDAVRERMQDAERDYARTRTLFEGGAVSREQLDKAATAFEVSRDQARQAEEQRELVRKGPRRERIDAARAVLAQAEATIAGVDAQLTNMVVRAPFDGVVTVRHREAGEVVPAGSPLLTIMNPGDRWVRIYVPENRLAAVKLGMRAVITSDTYDERTYPGEVTFIAPEAEFTPKTVQTTEERVKLVYAVKVRITGDAAHDLKPGMPADVQLVTESR